MKKFRILFILLFICSCLLVQGCGKKEKYTVNFITDTTDIISSQEIENGGKITKPADPTKEGYTFDGWYTNDKKWLFSEYTVTSDITLTARFIKNQINIKNSIKENNIYKIIVPNNNTSHNFKTSIELKGYKNYFISNDEYGSNTYVTKEVPLNDGNNYYFILCEKDNGDIDTYKVNVYRNHLYKVTFKTNTTSTIEPKQIEEGTVLTNIETLTKTGYTFKGWDYDFTKPITSNLVVNAIWEANQYTITYDPNEGTISTTTQIVTYDSEYSLLEPIYVGYAFMGWYYNDKLFNSTGNWTLTTDITLISKWSVEVRLPYVFKGGKNGGDNPFVSTNETETIILKNPTKTEAVFHGWYKEKEFINKVEKIEKGSIGDITLYAKWIECLKPFIENGNQYIYFGEYPQTLKDESVTIISNTPDSNGYYLGSDGEGYAKVTAKPYAINNKIIYFSNQQQIVKGTTYYFKVEPIKWKILQVNGTEYKLVTDLIIDNQMFHSSKDIRGTIDGKPIYASNYEHSDIRKWLNNVFYNQAFTKTLQSCINTTLVDNSPGSSTTVSNKFACNDTYDKVYLLSVEDMQNEEYGFIYNRSRQKQLTDYAKAKGCYMNTSTSCYNNGWFLLRSPHFYYDAGVKFVNDNGDLDYQCWVTSGDNGVSPAITITLS